MRAVIQRVSEARVDVAGETMGAIGRGLLVLLGVAHGDTQADAVRLAGKVCSLRIFEDADGRMNLDVCAVGGAVLCVSQFTLLGDVRRGNRPSFERAAPPDEAEPLYEAFCEAVRAEELVCDTGRFGAHMEVHLVNDGPVTLVLDTDDLARPRHA